MGLFPCPAPRGILAGVKARPTNLLILFAAPAALGAFAPLCANWHWSIDLAACFTVQAFGVLAIASITLAICRKWLPSIVFAVFCAIATTALTPYWGSADRPLEHVGNTQHVRLLTLNLLHSNEKGHQRALEVIREFQPEVIWCSEYTPRWQKFLRTALPDYPHRCEHPSQGSFGAAVYSRLPLALAEMVPLGHNWTPACRAVLQTSSGPIGFLGIHPPPPGLGRARAEERDRSLAAVPLALQNLPERRIVCGDFNATPWNACFERLRSATGLSAGSTTSWLPSWPSALPLPLRIPIDHVLVAGGLVVEQAQLGPSFGSDHLPLFTMVRITE